MNNKGELLSKLVYFSSDGHCWLYTTINRRDLDSLGNINLILASINHLSHLHSVHVCAKGLQSAAGMLYIYEIRAASYSMCSSL